MLNFSCLNITFNAIFLQLVYSILNSNIINMKKSNVKLLSTRLRSKAPRSPIEIQEHFTIMIPF